MFFFHNTFNIFQIYRSRFQACLTLKKLQVENLADSKCKLLIYSYLLIIF